MADLPLASRSPAIPLSHRIPGLRWLSSADQGPLDYGRRLWLKVVLAVIFITLYAPIAILIAFSFNDSRRNIVWQGFTTRYYGVAWRDASLVEAFVNSLTIAVMCTIIATVIGAMTALLLWRFRFPGKGG
jgi:spermidine/putrescine transport system permease protein